MATTARHYDKFNVFFNRKGYWLLPCFVDVRVSESAVSWATGFSEIVLRSLYFFCRRLLSLFFLIQYICFQLCVIFPFSFNNIGIKSCHAELSGFILSFLFTATFLFLSVSNINLFSPTFSLYINLSLLLSIERKDLLSFVETNNGFAHIHRSIFPFLI